MHYGVARAYADVTLSVQHDLQDDTISVSEGVCPYVLPCGLMLIGARAAA